jgi:hypothetical protein
VSKTQLTVRKEKDDGNAHQQHHGVAMEIFSHLLAKHTE